MDKKRMMQANLIKNATMLKQMMDSKGFETGDDMEKFTRQEFLPAIEQQAEKKPENQNMSVVQRYRSYL